MDLGKKKRECVLWSCGQGEHYVEKTYTFSFIRTAKTENLDENNACKKKFLIDRKEARFSGTNKGDGRMVEQVESLKETIQNF